MRNTTPEGVLYELTDDDCWALLERGALGRLAVTAAGVVDVFPVNYAVDGTTERRTIEFYLGRVGEFVDYVGKRPNELSYVVATFGGLGHLSMATFLKRAGLDVIPVTYSLGGAAPMTDVIGGHVPIFFATL